MVLDLWPENPPPFVGLKPSPKPIVDADTIRQELLKAYPSEDPAVKIAIEIVVDAFVGFQRVRYLRLESSEGLILFDIEGKIIRRFALHLQGAVMALRDLAQHSIPPVRIERVEQVQVAVVQPKPAKKRTAKTTARI